MTFWFTPFSDLIKKKVCRYLLHRYLGSFIDEKISLNQLNVDFYNGTGTISDIVLSPQALNELCENQGWDIEVTAGHIGKIDVNIPWNALMSENSCIEITNLYFVLRPKCRPKDGASMIESMWSSMSSSMQLAKDCLEHEGGISQNAPMEGLERFAQVIDNVLSRIKVKLNDTEIRLDYLTNENDRGITLVIKIKRLDYGSEAGGDPSDKPPNAPDGNDETYSIPIYSSHLIVMGNINFYMEEFRIVNGKRIPVNPIGNVESMMASEQFHSTISVLPESSLQESTYSDDDDETEQPDISRTPALKLAQLNGAIEIRLIIKQAASVQGPKVQLELQLGTINVFLSPRQLHALIHLSNIFLEENVPEMSESSAAAAAAEKIEKEAQLEEQLQQTRSFHAMTGNLGFNQGWSSDLYEQQSSTKDFDDDFMKSTSSMSGSVRSFASSTTQTTIRNRRRGIIEVDPNADILRLNIRIACCAIVLLEEDILVESLSEDTPLSEDSIKKLKQLSDMYFETTDELSINAASKDISKMSSLLEKGCKKNHLRLIFTAIIIEGEEQRNNYGNLLRLSLSIPRAELKEVLKDATIPLIEFYRDTSTGTLPKRPEISANIRQTTQLLRNSDGYFKFAAPKTEINCTIAPCLCELDISILDRLNAVLNSSVFYCAKNHGSTIDEVESKQAIQPKTNCIIESSSIDIRLRFPCTDLRPIHNTERIPWWKRNVLRDFFFINFCQVKIEYNAPSKYEIIANKIDLYYCENEEEPKIHIGNCVTLEHAANRFDQPIQESPKISIEIPTLEALATYLQKQQQSDDSSDGGLHSDIGFQIPKSKDPTPFSAKQVWRESDTPHSKSSTEHIHTSSNNGATGSGTQTNSEDQKLLMPGDITEMNKFCDDAQNSSKCQVNVTLPIVSLQLKSKHLYEVIYNRLICNLLLWSPSAPNNAPPAKPAPKTANPLLNVGMSDSVFIPFSMAKSNIIFDSSSTANSESDSDSDNIYYSTVYESKRQQSSNLPKQDSYMDRSSQCTLKLNVGQGMLTMYSPVRDSANRVIPGQLGEFVIKLNNGYVFSVNGFRGCSNLNFVCVQASSFEIYHIGLIPVPSSNPPLRLIGCVLPSHVQSTLYPTPKDLTINQPSGKKVTNREMLSIAIQFKSMPEQRLKRVKVSAGLQLATLRYNSALPEHSWFHQLMDMFNVEEYPVQGYNPFVNVTEMHFHLWDCSVDYRPRFFDYRAVLGINTFMISTTLSSTSLGCTVRFVAEDGNICIAPQTPIGEFKFKNENKITSLPSSDLVCVFEFALLEISLRENEKATDFAPKYDARAAMNGAHLRVCADSCLALGNLIAYIAAEGDLTTKKENEVDEEEQLMTSRELDADLLAVNAQNRPEVTADQQQRVNQLMEEAMQECVRPSTDNKTSSGDRTSPDDDAEIFYFPDEAETASSAVHKAISASEFVGLSSASSIRRSSRTSKSTTSLNKDDDDTISVGSGSSDISRRQTTDLQEIIDFETSVLGLKGTMEIEASEEITNVGNELGVPQKLRERNRKISSDTDDDFIFIGDEERPKYGIEAVVSTDEPIRILDNHFSIPLDKHDMLKAPASFPQAVTRYTLCDLSISMHFYGGNDFLDPDQKSENQKEGSQEKVTSVNYTSESYRKVAFSKESSTVTFPVKTKSSAQKTQRPWKERGGINRNFDVCIEIHSNKGRFSHETYPTNTREASRQVLVLSDFEIWDRLACSSFNKMFYTGRSERSKKSDQATMYIKCIFIRPEPTLPSQEANLYISFMPKVNINIDQDAMIFIANFFAQLNGKETTGTDPPRPTRSPTTPTHQPPVMIVEMPEVEEIRAREMVDDNLLLLMDDEEEKEKPASEPPTAVTDNSPVYFRSVTFSPEVELTINYCGKRVQMTHGPVMGLIMGLGQLNCSKICLKKINYRRGLLGIDRVINHLIKEWLNHIKNKQLPSLLQGIGPMNSIVIFFQGVIDLFRLPYKQYQRDGRIVRGLQLGAQSFTSRTALAALELTTRIIYLLQVTAETAYDMLSPGPSVRSIRLRRKNRRRLHRPQDIREGVTNAYYILKEGVGETANSIAELAAIERDHKGMTGAVGAVIREIPPTIVKPIVLATQATSNVLGGVRNQLVPDARIEAKEKWKEDEQ